MVVHRILVPKVLVRLQIDHLNYKYIFMINLWDIKLSQCFIVKHNYYKSEIYKFQLIGFTDTIVYIRNIDLHGKMMKPSDDDKNNARIHISAFIDSFTILKIL